jgi:hypothetical protein
MLRSLIVTLFFAFPLRAQAPALWRVEATPVMATAGADATEAAELLHTRGAIRLTSGHIVVANGKPVGLKVFAPNGSYLRTIGRSGGGPGEFRHAVDVYRWPGDSIHAVSSSGARHALFRLDGTMIREWTSETIMYGTVAVYRRAALHIPVGGVSECMRTAVDGLPAPPAGTIREAREARPGVYWVRTIGEREWQVVDARGGVRARLSLPEGFEMFQVAGDLVLGREFDADDIERIAVYRVTGATTLSGSPACDGMRAPVTPTLSPRLPDLKMQIRNLLTSGEGYYSQARRYPTTLAEARFETPEGIDVAIISSSSRGWAVAASDRDTGVTCMVATGASVLVGYAEGVIQCGG